MALKPLLVDIADAIREKDGTADLIVAEDFPKRILDIPSSTELSTIRLSAEPAETVIVSGGGMASPGMTVTVNAEAREEDKYDYGFTCWQEHGQTVSEDEAYTFPVTGDRELLALFEKYPYVLGADWWTVTMPGTAYFRSIAYGDGKFIAQIDNGYIEYSTDCVNWTVVKLPSLSSCRSITYGDGTFVVVGYNTSVACYSKDGGISWTATNLPAYASWYAVTYGDGKFVAVSNNNSNKVAYSNDGINWAASTLPLSGSYSRIVYGNGKFLIIDYITGTALYSTDGIEWNIGRVLPESGGWGYNIVYGNGMFICVSASTALAAYSTDGINWSTTSTPESGSYYTGVYGNKLFIVLNSNTNKAIYSTNGIDWEVVELPVALNWTAVWYGDGQFLAVAYNSNKAIYSSAKGPPISAQIATIQTLSSIPNFEVENDAFISVESSAASAARGIEI